MDQKTREAIVSAHRDRGETILDIATKFGISQAEVNEVIRATLGPGERYMDGHGYKIKT